MSSNFDLDSCRSGLVLFVHPREAEDEPSFVSLSLRPLFCHTTHLLILNFLFLFNLTDFLSVSLEDAEDQVLVDILSDLLAAELREVHIAITNLNFLCYIVV